MTGKNTKLIYFDKYKKEKDTNKINMEKTE